MSAAAILTYPDFYKVAVSVCGNHDNNIYDYEWAEFQYGPQMPYPTNPDIAKNLKGRLMLVHGEVDNNVHPAHTFRLVNELIKAGKRFDMLIVPGQKHAFAEYHHYYERRLWYYFAEHLLGDLRKNTDIFNHTN